MKKFQNFHIFNVLYNDVIILLTVLTHLLLAIYIVYRSETTIDHQMLLNYEYKKIGNSYVNISNVRKVLKELTTMDSRMFPSNNNKASTNYLLKVIYDTIFKITEDNQKKLLDNFFNVNVELFTPNGSAVVDIIGRRSYLNYQLVPNIIVTLSPKNEALDSYCLINSHYDSVIGSPGASDNGMFTSIVIEMIAHFARYKDYPNNITSKKYYQLSKKFKPYCNLLFILNGAEEAAMVAASAYITQHKLRDKISVLINLDSAGGDGQGYLFQTTTGASHLIKIYKKVVPNPRGNSFFEEIFSSGFIPADTDFKIFRDLGNIHGLDIAISGNAHQYHNEHDAEYHISDITLSRETIKLCLLYSGLITDPSINDLLYLKNQTHNKDMYIYFDFLGKFMVVYPQTLAYFINIVLVLLFIPLMLKDLKNATKGSTIGHCLKVIGIFFICHVLSILFAVCIGFITAYVMDKTNHLLSYNTYYITGLLLYGLPIEFSYLTCYNYLLNVKFQRYLPYDPQLKHIFIYWTYMCIKLFYSSVGTLILDLRSCYIPLISIITLLPMYRIRQYDSLCRYSSSKLYSLFYYTLYMVFTFFWTLYKVYLTHTFFRIALHFFDRTPCIVPSEYIVVCCVAFATFSVFSSINSLVISMDKINRLFSFILSMLWIIVLCIIFFTTLSPPYLYSISPKRLSAHHMIQTQFSSNMDIKNSSAKMVIMATDHNCLRGYGKDLNARLHLLSSVDPFWHTINAFGLISDFKSSFYYYETKIPKIKQSETRFFLNQTSIEVISPLKRRFYYQLYGDEATLIDIIMPISMRISRWSLSHPSVPNGKSTNNYDIYNNIYFIADPNEPINFWIDIEILDQNLKFEDAKFYIIVVKHRIKYSNETTDDFLVLKKVLPDYVAPVFNVIERLDYEFHIFHEN